MEVLSKNIKILNHPIIDNNLAVIRDKNSDCEKFKNAVKRITYMLIYEAAKELPTIEKIVETPLEKTTCKVFDNSAQVVIAPILRAGMIFCEVAQELLPFANVHHIGMYRDETTLEPVWYYDKTPVLYENPKKIKVFILDPMIATGNSSHAAISLFLKKGILIENIVFVSILSCPEGLNLLCKDFPELKIITAKIDEGLNERGYIVPGLGDAGDRLFNTFEK